MKLELCLWQRDEHHSYKMDSHLRILEVKLYDGKIKGIFQSSPVERTIVRISDRKKVRNIKLIQEENILYIKWIIP